MQQQFTDLQDQLNMFRAIFCPSLCGGYISLISTYT